MPLGFHSTMTAGLKFRNCFRGSTTSKSSSSRWAASSGDGACPRKLLDMAQHAGARIGTILDAGLDQQLQRQNAIYRSIDAGAQRGARLRSTDNRSEALFDERCRLREQQHVVAGLKG